MKKLFFLFIVLANTVVGQYNPDAKRDYKWYIGYHFFGDPDSYISSLNFNQSPLVIDTVSCGIDFTVTNTGLCDENGQTLFVTNGFRVANRSLELMPNGDSLSYGLLYNNVVQYMDGNHFYQAAIAFKIPESFHKYIIIHEKSVDSIYYKNPMTALQYTTVDMMLENGMGNVTEKNVLLLDDTLDQGAITAVRHGNGRDWWVLVPKAFYNCYYVFLLTPTGIALKHTQCFSESRHEMIFCGSSVFSPDGQYYIRQKEHLTFTPSIIEIYNFDRCLGSLNLLTSFYFDSTGGALGGVAVSPNSRYLYVTRLNYLYQFDLHASDIESSKVLVASCDSLPDPFAPLVISGLIGLHLAPDGKIYIVQGASFLGVIHNPDSAGLACNAEQHALYLPRFDLGYPPTFPNYRLGRLVGSECDTLVWSGIKEPATEKPAQLLASPNPASGNMRFELNTSNFDTEGNLEIYNLTGSKIRSIAVARFQGIVPFDVSNLPDGMYLAVFKQEGGVLGTVRFVVSR